MTTIRMPQLGETIVEGTILKWLKQEGEAIDRDEPLFEISTDKVDTEVPSPVAGTVEKILVQEGQTVPVGTDLAEVSEDGKANGASAGDGTAAAPEDTAGSSEAATEAPQAEAQTPATAESAEAVSEGSAAEMPAAEPATPQGQQASDGTAEAVDGAGGAAPQTEGAREGRSGEATATGQGAAASAERGQGQELPDRGPRSKILSPLVRRLAEEHSLDLARIEGTGTGGRITKGDVMAAISAGGATAQAPAATAPAAAPAPAQPAAAQPAAAPAAQPAVSEVGAGDEVVPISHIRKAIGQHMLKSLETSARAWTMVEVNVDHLVKLRDRAKDAFKQKHGVNLTYLPFVIRATCDALLTHPEVNAELRGDQIVLHHYVNMGIAVSYDAGLIVPVIKGADSMNTVGLARAIADLASRARAHQLKPDEVQGSTFTITNPGPYGSIASVPIINQPNAGILSFDAIQKRPVVIDDTIAIRSMVNISMSWDHRTIDGEIATKFLARVKQNLEAWDFAEDVTV
jgi:pyruvate dehydrogenase E2 component (dihydrolipoamide acetyltransferase)